MTTTQRQKIASCLAGGLLILGHTCAWLVADCSTSIAATRLVQNQNRPSDGTRNARLREVWRIGDDEDGTYFGKVERIVADENGTTYVLDRQRKVVQCIDRSGKWMRSYGRAGDGPGEFGSVCDLFLVSGTAIGVAQVIPGKAVMMSMQGDPLPSIYTPDFGGVNTLYRAIATGPHLVMASRTMSASENGELEARSMVYSIQPDSKLGVVYQEMRSAGPMVQAMTLSEEALLGFTYFWDVGDRGQVYISDEWGAYRIKVFSEGGALETIISRECEASRRSHDNLAQRRARYSLDLVGAAVDINFAATER